ISMVLVAADTPGVEIGKRHMPLHQAFLNGPIVGKDVFIPLDNVIGGAAMLGKGWQMMTTCLAVGRGISLPAVSTAVTKLCYRMTGAYARVREQFGVPIGQFEGVAAVLARIGSSAYIAEAARCFTTTAIDSGVKPAVASAITKYHLTELSRTVINDAMDVHGGRGIMMGEDNYLANVYTAIPIGITVEGANILTRNLIIFGQGAFRCHPYLAQELIAANDNDLKGFDQLIFAHIGYWVKNFTRALLYGLFAGKGIRVGQRDFKRYYQQLTRMSCALALATDCAFIVLGGELKRRENLSARLGDVLSHLYLASSVLKYYSDQGKPEADSVFVQYTVEKALFDAQTALQLFLDNLPNRLIAWVLQHTIFCWGNAYRLPQDALAIKIANASMQQSDQRDRITQYCSTGANTERMEAAFTAAIAASEANRKMRKAKLTPDVALAQGVINQDEFEHVMTYLTLQNAAIQVAAFATQKGSEYDDNLPA
ncbi:MAG: DUF1974 domain-containing protein, partial [Pseudomonadota bacterium]|nr:DUF1974 domain-containing protein [Pseudomonadota bacterium]